ncbi:MAG: WecB/TagA/CpsF family glycosyltransferase [Lachnospiraceae bacterium]|nr:WecB/TagA/CpsF family glycosyltransferase [Lachnospiraceae bacterium]
MDHRLFDKQPLLNTRVNNLTMTETLECIEYLIETGQKSYVVEVNVDVIIRIEEDPYLQRIVDEADLVLVDGQPLVWISRWHKRPVQTRIAGSDMVPRLCEEAAARGQRIFIIGGQEDVTRNAKEKLEERLPDLKITGTYSPPMGFETDPVEQELINEMISAARPDILIACFGCPKQEKWIYENYRKYDATVSVCAGATVDFLAGAKKRAPAWMGRWGLEWLFRLCQEPKRMFRRYFIDDLKIFRLIRKYGKINRANE